uniref:Uncharacterized protein n=1 Tax=Romanomermis culicivorax TaxID=13658 RepID=A0A915JUP4_ROMCU
MQIAFAARQCFGGCLKSEKFGSCKEIREMPYCVIENHGFFALKTPCHDEKAGAPCVVEVAEISAQQLEDVGKCQWHKGRNGCQIFASGEVLTLDDNTEQFEVILDGCYTSKNKDFVMRSLVGP